MERIMKKNLKRIIAVLLAFAFIAAPVAKVAFAAEDTKFSDVAVDNQYYEEIMELAEEGVINGRLDGTFGPDGSAKREHVAKMIVRALGLEGKGGHPTFKDVPEGNQYAEDIAVTEDEGIFTGDLNNEFGLGKDISRRHIASVIVRAFGLEAGDKEVTFTDIYSSADEKAIEAIEILASNGIVDGYLDNTYRPDDNVTRGHIAKMIVNARKVAAEQDELVVKSVSAINAKALKVTFSAAVENTEDAVFNVKRGNTVVATTATWNEEKTEATLTSSVKLAAGDYVVTVSGVELVEDADSAETTVAPERIEKIELEDNAYEVSGTPTSVTVDYKLVNQYDEDVTEDYATTNFTVTSNKGTVTAPSAKGVITITTVPAGTETLTVTMVDKTFAKTASKAVAVQGVKALANITLAQPEVPAGKDNIERTAKDVVIPYEAVDQFGEKVVLPVGTAANAGLTIISSDTTVLPVANVVVKSLGGKDKLAITGFGALNGKKDITLTAIVNATGETSKVTFTVFGVATAKTPTLVAPAANPGVGDNTFNIELKMLDVYGNEMKAADVDALTTSDVTIISSNPSIFTVAGSQEPQLVDKKSVVQINAIAEGTANLMITVNATGETSTLAVTVVEAKYPANMTLSLDKDVAAKDGEVVLKATFNDQYGNEIKTSNNQVKLSADNALFTYEDSGAKNLKDNPKMITVTELAKNGLKLKATDWDKITKVKAELSNHATFASGTVVDTKNITLQSPKADAEYTYTIEKVSTLYGKTEHAMDSNYAQVLKLVAKDASGKTVSLPSGYVTNITSTNSVIGADAASMKVWATDKGTSTIALWKGAEKLAEIEVTASDVTPKAETIKFKEQVITIDSKDVAGALAAIKAELEIKDQYGVAIDPVGGTSGMWTSDKSEIAFTTDTISTYGNVTDATIGFITNNGKAATMKITVTDAG